METQSITIKEETRTAVINALRELANRKHANQLRSLIEQIKTLNLNVDEQWGLLDRFADKVVKFKQSKNVADLQ